MEKKILVVDDEKPIADILQYHFKKEGFAVHGEEALDLVEEMQPDIVLLDIMLPGRDGLEVCREIRKKHGMPIIMLTAKDAELDKALAFEFGEDNYVSKPFSTIALIACVKSKLLPVCRNGWRIDGSTK